MNRCLRRILALSTVWLLLLIGGEAVYADTFTVFNPDDEGIGTLRYAMLSANARPGADTIVFDLPWYGTTLTPLEPLPIITETVTIDGTTQPGRAGFPLVEIDGSFTPSSQTNGLEIAAPNCFIKGLTINRCGQAGIFVTSSAVRTQVIGCHLGTDVGGTVALGNAYGIQSYANSVSITSCLISGNGFGVFGFESAFTLRDSRIGTDISGGLAVGNGIGVVASAGYLSRIEDCTVSGNFMNGIEILPGQNPVPQRLSIVHCMVGLSEFFEPLSNGENGIVVRGAGVSITNSLITSNAGSGIAFQMAAASRVENNIVLGNGAGIRVEDGSQNVRIHNNSISGNLTDGVYVASGSTGTEISSCDIGGNFRHGCFVLSNGQTLSDNLITENGVQGVAIGAPGMPAQPNFVQVSQNRIYNNGDLGIWLEGRDGAGANRSIQPPILSLALSDETRTLVTGTVFGRANTVYTLEFFLSAEPDPSGWGEGEQYLGTATVTTSAGGTGTFNATLPGTPIGLFLTATATENGNTSSFSFVKEIGEAQPIPVLNSISPGDVYEGSAAITLTLTGTRFRANSVARWNGVALETVFVSAGELQATVPASYLTTAGTAQITVFTPAPGGGESNALPFLINNRQPTLTALSPTTVLRGSPQFTLSLRGTGFINGSTVRWNGVERTTQFVSVTEVRITVPASDLLQAAEIAITVENPAPGGGISDPKTFTVANPVPVITSLSPSGVTAGSSSLMVTITGSGFIPQSDVELGGRPMRAIYLSPTRLQFTMSRRDMERPETNMVTVSNPAPGGGTSNGKPFVIGGTPQLALLAATATRAANGAVTVTFTLKNIGTLQATRLKINAAKLAGVNTNNSPALPMNLPDIAPNGISAPISLTFPNSTPAGAQVFAVTILSGSSRSLTASRRITVP